MPILILGLPYVIRFLSAMVIPDSKEEICTLLFGMEHIGWEFNTNPLRGLIFNKTGICVHHFCIIRHDLYHLFDYVFPQAIPFLSHLSHGAFAYTKQQEVYTMDTGLNDLEKMKLLRRRRERNEREEQRKEDNHWCFVAGALVAKYLKADLRITVYKGKDAAEKNRASFAPLENILCYLAEHKDLTTRIASGVRDPLDFP